MANNRRILHFPTNTGDHPYSLSLIEKKAGHISHCVTLKSPQFGYKSDFTLYKGRNPLLTEMIRWVFFIFSLFYYNEFHFNYGSKFFTYIAPDFKSEPNLLKKIAKFIYHIYCSLFGKFDLFILKLLRKKIIVTFQGNDIRQGDYCRAHYKFHFVTEVAANYYTPFTDERKRKLIRLFDKYADEIYALNPDLLNVLPPRAHFYPYKREAYRSSFPSQDTQKKFTVIHAPTDRKIKGTDSILNALKELKTEGLNFEIKLIENLPYHTALELYKNADLAIDQIWAGWYGGFAVDVMQFGVPVMAYIRESDLIHIPKDFRSEIPILNIDPSDLKNSIRRNILAVQNGNIQKAEIQKFVEKWHI